VAVVTTGAAYSYALFPVTSATQQFSLSFTNFSSAATLEIILGGACSAGSIDAQPNFTCITSGWDIVAGADEGPAASFAVADAPSSAEPTHTNLAYVDGLLATPGVVGSSGPFAGGYWTGVVDTVAWTSVVEAPLAYAEMVRNARGQVEGEAQRFPMKTGNFFVCTSINTTAGRPCVASCFVRLGTATNFCLAVTDDQTWNSPSVARAFGAADGLNATGYTQVFLPFKISSSRLNVQCGWADGTGPGAVMKTQTEGSVYAYGWQVRLQEQLATLGGLSVGNPGAAPWSGLRVEGDGTFGGNLVVSGTVTALQGGGTVVSQKLQAFDAAALQGVGGASFALADGLPDWVKHGNAYYFIYNDTQQMFFTDSSSYLSLSSAGVVDVSAFVGQTLRLRFAAWGDVSLRVCITYDSGLTVSGMFATTAEPQYFSLAFTPATNATVNVLVGGPSGLFGSTAAAQPVGHVNASHWSISAGTLTTLTGGLSVERLNCTGAATVGAAGTFGGDLAVLGSSTLTGQVTSNYAVSLRLAGAKLAPNASAPLAVSSSTTGSLFLKFLTVLDSHNWIPSYANNVQLEIRHTGLYFMNLLMGCTVPSSGDILISQGTQGTALSQGQFDGNLLTSQPWNTAYTGYDVSCSCNAHLTSSQLINFVVFLASGTLTLGDRCRAQVVLIQQTA
jgi:hypothetical protein